jgi:hypothetical protein
MYIDAESFNWDRRCPRIKFVAGLESRKDLSFELQSVFRDIVNLAVFCALPIALIL